MDSSTTQPIPVPAGNNRQPTGPLANTSTAPGLGTGAPALAWRVATNQGPRKENQDCALVVPPNHPLLPSKGVLLIVCDGVGGEEGGHIAANKAAQEAMRAYYDAPFDGPASAQAAAQAALAQSVERAWQAVKGEANSRPKFGRMATTIVMIAVQGNQLHVAHVGDSRAYLYRNGRLTQLTQDHTFVNVQIQKGAMTEEQARTSIYRSTLVRSLGAAGDHTPDFSTETLQPGDRVLLCSDGLHGVVTTEQIVSVLDANPDPGRAVSHLVAAAIANQTADNVTALVLNYGTPASAPALAGAAQRPVWLVPAIVAVLVIALGAGGWAVLGASRSSDVGRNATATPAATVLAAAIASPSAGTSLLTTTAVSEVAGTPAPVATVNPNLPPSATLRPGEPTATLAPLPTPTETPLPKPTRAPATRAPTTAPVNTLAPTIAGVPSVVVPPTAVPPTNVPPPRQNPGGGDPVVEASPVPVATVEVVQPTAAPPPTAVPPTAEPPPTAVPPTAEPLPTSVEVRPEPPPEPLPTSSVL